MALNTQKEVWSVYLENQDIFASVLRATGPWHLGDGMDLVHDFLVDYLPQALKTFDPNRGAIRPWLFTVFTRYAKRRRVEKLSVESRWLTLDQFEATEPETDESLSASEKTRVWDALSAMPDDLRLSLLTYFGDGPNAGNIRGIGRKNNWSRHRTQQVLLNGLATLAARLAEQGILAREELEVCRAYLLLGETWQEIAERLEKTEHQTRTLMKSALAKFRSSLNRK